jgi:F-type H+-transporting ATPase subunit delta
MNDSIISVRYCRAIFRSAVDKGILDKVNRDMTLISEICTIPETKEFLKNPVITPTQKTEIFHKMLAGGVESLTLSLIDLLVKNGRESFLPAIARVFNHETLKYKGITKSVLTTATAVDEKVKNRIVKLISDVFKTSVELQEVVDSNIIGGFVLRVDDSYIDASVKSKLGKIRKEFGKSSLSSI